MGWKQYAIALLLFNVLGALAVYALQRAAAVAAAEPAAVRRTSRRTPRSTRPSASSPTRTGRATPAKSTMSYLTQMAGLAVQNFLSAATGIVVAIALIRGLARHSAKTIGNFWVDITRSTLYILLPLSLVLALVLVSAGRDPELQRLQGRDDASRAVAYQQPEGGRRRAMPVKDAAGNPVTGGRDDADTDAADGPDGVAGEHQGARHQRRRLLQRQLGASVRESDAAVEFPRDAGDPADPGGADLHLRADGGRYPPGLGGACGDG